MYIYIYICIGDGEKLPSWKAGWATGPLRKGFVGFGLFVEWHLRQLLPFVSAKHGTKETYMSHT